MYCDGCYKSSAEDEFPIRKPTDEDGIAVEIKEDKDRFKYGRAGDGFMTTFQCDVCHFRNLQGRDPDAGGGKDRLLLRFIRRASLDSLWSRSANTVDGNLAELRKLFGKANLLGINDERMFPAMGPFAVRDDCGMGVAVCSLARSMDPGKNEQFVQFSTVRRLRSCYSNMWHASLQGGLDSVAVRDMTKLIQTSCPTNGAWYERFNLGMHSRMGDMVIQDRALASDVMMELMREFEVDWSKLAPANERKEQEEVLFPALFSILSFLGGLRGEEMPMADLAGMRNHFVSGTQHSDPAKRHVVLALLGRFKGETGEKYHLMPLSVQTESGFRVDVWVGRMIQWYEVQGVNRGPVFRRVNGKRARGGDYEPGILERLERVQERRPDLIPLEVNLLEEFGVRRSFRRGSNSEALARGVSGPDIDANNRWRVFEKAGGKRPSLQMRQHYADVRIMLDSLLRYSRAL
jgi:hypothetical protein